MARRKSQHTESPSKAGRLGKLGQHELDSPLPEILMTGFERGLNSPI